jgi:hypothetical protein
MNQPSMEDRRKFKRQNLVFYMLIVDATTQETFGHLIDLTPDGFLMDSPKELLPEQEFRLRLDTTPDIVEKKFITFTARCKWCMPDGIEPNLYDAGFLITEIAPEDAAILTRITDTYASQDGFSYRQL